MCGFCLFLQFKYSLRGQPQGARVNVLKAAWEVRSRLTFSKKLSLIQPAPH